METNAKERATGPPVFVNGMGDGELVSSLLAGDRKASSEFVTRYTDILFSYIWQRMLPRTDVVEDLVQDCFLIAWRSLPQYRGEASLEGWLLGIARHCVEGHYRKRLRESLDQLEEEELPDAIAGSEPLWDEELDQQRLLEHTRRVLALLPEPYSVALQWRYWEKRSTYDIAASTGKTVKSVERLLARARECFRARWEHG